MKIQCPHCKNDDIKLIEELARIRVPIYIRGEKIVKKYLCVSCSKTFELEVEGY